MKKLVLALALAAAPCAALAGPVTSVCDPTGQLCLTPTSGGGITATINGVANTGTNYDGVNTTTAFNTVAFPYAFNGTNFDRIYDVVGAVSLGSSSIGRLAVEEAGRPYSHISTAATTTVKSGKGFLHALNVNTCVSGATVTLYDNTAASGTVIGVVTCPAATNALPTMLYDVAFSTGLTLVTSAATDLTVAYR